MKICYLINQGDNHAMRWIKYLEGLGYEMIPLKIFRCGIKSLEIIINFIPVLIQIKIKKPDVLHAYYAGVNGVLGALSGFHPFVLTAEGSDILITRKSKLIRPLIEFVLKKADLITCDAYHMKNAMINLGAEHSKIEIIYFGVDIEKFFPGNKKGGPKVISLRNLEPIYDVETFIKAIPLILKEVPETKFIVAGHGPEEKKLKKLAFSLKIEDKITFIGWVSEEELIKNLQESDVYVSTSLSDAGIAASTAEAMACGLPVVVSDFGDNAQWVKKEGGFLFPLQDFKQLAEKVTFLLKDKELRLKRGKFNRELIEKKNNQKIEMEKMKKIYEKFS